MQLPDKLNLTLISFTFAKGTGNQESLILWDKGNFALWGYWPGVGVGDGKSIYQNTFEELLEALGISVDVFKRDWRLISCFFDAGLGRDLGVSYNWHGWKVLWHREGKTYQQALEIAIVQCQLDVNAFVARLNELDNCDMDASNLDWEEEKALYGLYEREERLDWLKRFPSVLPALETTISQCDDFSHVASSFEEIWKQV